MEEECCPKFNPEKWNNKTHKWKDKLFLKETIPTFFHMPFPPMIGKKIVKMMKIAEREKAIDKDKQNVLVLFHDPSAFKSEIYLSITKNISNENVSKISGTFVSKVFDGAFNAVPKFIKEMDGYLKKQNKKAKDYYVHYAYCPKCAKKYGHNYMILFAEI